MGKVISRETLGKEGKDLILSVFKEIVSDGEETYGFSKSDWHNRITLQKHQEYRESDSMFIIRQHETLQINSADYVIAVPIKRFAIGEKRAGGTEIIYGLTGFSGAYESDRFAYLRHINTADGVVRELAKPLLFAFDAVLFVITNNEPGGSGPAYLYNGSNPQGSILMKLQLRRTEKKVNQAEFEKAFKEGFEKQARPGDVEQIFGGVLSASDFIKKNHPNQLCITRPQITVKSQTSLVLSNGRESLPVIKRENMPAIAILRHDNLNINMEIVAAFQKYAENQIFDVLEDRAELINPEIEQKKPEIPAPEERPSYIR